MSNMQEINRPTLERVPGNPPDLDPQMLEDLAGEIYPGVFRGEPWNEAWRCPEGEFFGLDKQCGDACPNCGGPLTEAYPREETREYVTQELARPDAALWLLRTPQGKLAGFSWAFSYESPEEFANEKYRTPEMRATIVRALGGCGITGRFFYLSESGIDPNSDMRGFGMSNEMHAVRLAEAQRLGLPAVQRTSAGGPMYRTSSKFMQQISGPIGVYEKGVRRIIVTDEMAGPVDTEREDRALFVRLPDEAEVANSSTNLKSTI